MNTLTSIIMTLACLLTPASGSLLEKMQSRIASMGTIEISVNVEGTDVKVISSGHRYLMESPGMRIWCDGESQWVYNEDSQEMTVTAFDPEGDDVTDNPTVILTSSILRSYSVTGEKDGCIILQARKGKKPAYPKMEIRVDRSDLPTSLTVTNTSGNSAVMKIISVKSVSGGHSITFRPSEKLLGSCEVTDLR